MATFKIVTVGSTLTFSVPRRALGNPALFTFVAAGAREMEQGATGAGFDVAPTHSTLHYTLTG